MLPFFLLVWRNWLWFTLGGTKLISINIDTRGKSYGMHLTEIDPNRLTDNGKKDLDRTYIMIDLI